MQPTVLSLDQLPSFYAEHLAANFDFHHNVSKDDLSTIDKLAPQVRAIACKGETVLSGETMARFPKLEAIAVCGVGYDGVDVAAARARGIKVSNTPEVLTDDVADLAIALMLAVSRRIVGADQYVRSGAWGKEPLALARRVSGARLGMVGLGRIGQAIATRAEGFGMSIAYTARSAKPALPYTFYASPRELAENVDFLIVATFGGPTTRGLVGREVLDALGPNGYLVNIARGSVIDEDELVLALQEKRIAGAGLDVFVAEPKVPAALLAMDNVVLTPHIGSATVGTRQAMADLAYANLAAHFAGQPLITPIPA